MPRSLLGSAVALTLIACAAGCSARADFEKICNAEALSGASSADPAEKAVVMAKWLEENVKSSDAKNALAALASASPDMRGKLLQAAAREAGYDGPCPLAELE